MYSKPLPKLLNNHRLQKFLQAGIFTQFCKERKCKIHGLTQHTKKYTVYIQYSSKDSGALTSVS